MSSGRRPTDPPRRLERLQPQVVLLDIQLPDLDGFAVAERLAALPDPPRVVLISSRDASAYGPRLGETSARGFLSKARALGPRSRGARGLSGGASAPAVAVGRPARRSE